MQLFDYLGGGGVSPAKGAGASPAAGTGVGASGAFSPYNYPPQSDASGGAGRAASSGVGTAALLGGGAPKDNSSKAVGLAGLLAGL